jgi:hypothetical protein
MSWATIMISVLQCRLWVRLGPQPMLAARPLHPPIAGMLGLPSDVAEGPTPEVEVSPFANDLPSQGAAGALRRERRAPG